MDSTFLKKLEELINSISLEMDSNTPDFILAEFVCDVLVAYSKAVEKRDNWYKDTAINKSIARGDWDALKRLEGTTVPSPMKDNIKSREETQ